MHDELNMYFSFVHEKREFIMIYSYNQRICSFFPIQELNVKRRSDTFLFKVQAKEMHKSRKHLHVENINSYLVDLFVLILLSYEYEGMQLFLNICTVFICTSTSC